MEKLVDLLEAYPLPEVKEKPKYKIYCDMDGVLTDFESRFDHFTGMTPKEYEAKYGVTGFWNLIDVKVGIKFWSEMPWMPRGSELWSFISKYNPSLLTSPSRDNGSRLGKNIWAKDNLSPSPRVIFAYSKDKQRYARLKELKLKINSSKIGHFEELFECHFQSQNIEDGFKLFTRKINNISKPQKLLHIKYFKFFLKKSSHSALFSQYKNLPPFLVKL